MNTPKLSRPRVRARWRSLGAASVAAIVVLSLTQLSVSAQEPTTTTTEPTTTTTEPTTTTSESTTTTTAGPPAVEADEANEDEPISALVVPTPGTGESVITVKVGGTRSGPTTVLPQAGVTLQLFDNATTTTPTTFVTPNTCVSDVDGDCNWVVDDTNVPQPGGNQDRRFWVRQIAPPGPNTYSNPQLNVGVNTYPATTYQFQTCVQLRGGQTCSSQATGVNGFMLSTTTADAAFTASGGIWQTSRNNPVLTARCGLRVALILDLSGSVAGDIPELHTAATTFVSTLVGTPSSVGLFTFASNGPANATNNQNRPLTSVSTNAGAATVNAWINGTTAQGGESAFTNWDRALNQVTESAQPYDVALIVTDGNPTAYGIPVTHTDARTRFREVENGIFSANGLKAEGTRVVAFGVGDGVGGSGLNLRSISGPTLGSDYFQTTDYPEAAGVLRALALGACQGTVSVIKQVIPPGGTIATAAPAPGWTFGATTSTSGVTIDPTTSQTDATGGVNFALTFPGGVTSAAVTVTETQQAGYTLVQQAGANATCRRIDTQAAVPTTNSGPLGFQLAADPAVPISCTVYNQAPNPPATVQVNKQWTVNGVSYANGNQPPGLSAQPTINGAPAAFGSVVPGFTQGQQVSINETVTINLPLCTVTGSRVTLANGATVDAALPYSAALGAGANAYTITNVVTCTSSLQLAKTVANGPALPTAWTLTAITPGGALPGPTGTTGVTANVTPGVIYPLAESGGNPNYVQDDQRAAPVPGSTGSWRCVVVDEFGTEIPGFSDGINGGVTVPLGQRVQCTATNRTATLDLRKVVENNFGGTATSPDWTLTATPTGTPPPGVVAQSVAGSVMGTEVFVRPGQEYALTESGPAGYQLVSIVCETGETPPAPAATIILDAGESGVCTYTNEDVAPLLTLVKTVTNDNGGTADATDWTLEADGPTPISGATGSTAVTSAPVSVGTYELSESDGPSGYTPSDWTCTSGEQVLVGDSIDLDNGDVVTCTINNDDQPATITLFKTVTNDHGGTALPTSWSLRGAGPTVFDGPTGSVAVTNRTVNAGAYTLSEGDGPTGYAAGPWGCVGGGTLVGNVLTLANGQDAVCGLNNDDEPATITLVKTVVNDNGGTAGPEDWTLSATGPETISGVNGSAAVTAAVVPVGPYTLSESGGPAGYTASDWVCTAAEGESTTPLSVEAGVVALAGGVSVTCTITNDDQAVSWDLNKVSDPPTGSVVMPGATITYTVTATNTGSVAPTGLSVNDDLADVLDNATLVPGSVTFSTGTASVTGTTLNWTIPTLATTATVTYKVTVNAGAFNTSIGNVVTGAGDGETPTSPPPTNCPAPAQTSTCTTRHPVGPPPTITTTPPPAGALPFRSPTPTTPARALPFSGAESGGLVGLGLVLIGLGVGMLAVRRRRLSTT